MVQVSALSSYKTQGGTTSSSVVPHSAYFPATSKLTSSALKDCTDGLLDKIMVTGYLLLWCSTGHKLVKGVDFISWYCTSPICCKLPLNTSPSHQCSTTTFLLSSPIHCIHRLAPHHPPLCINRVHLAGRISLPFATPCLMSSPSMVLALAF